MRRNWSVSPLALEGGFPFGFFPGHRFPTPLSLNPKSAEQTEHSGVYALQAVRRAKPDPPLRATGGSGILGQFLGRYSMLAKFPSHQHLSGFGHSRELRVCRSGLLLWLEVSIRAGLAAKEATLGSGVFVCVAD